MLMMYGMLTTVRGGVGEGSFGDLGTACYASYSTCYHLGVVVYTQC